MPLEEFLEELNAIQTRLVHSVGILPGVEVGAEEVYLPDTPFEE
jgi:hypothetical protein